MLHLAAMAVPVVPGHPIESYVAFVSAYLASTLGLNYFAVVWAFIGAMVALTRIQKMNRTRALVYVMLSTLIGALLSTFAADWWKVQVPSAIAFMALLGGMSWQRLTAAAVLAFEHKLRGFLPTERGGL